VLSNTLVRPGAPVRVQGSSDTPGDTGEPGKRVLSSWGLSKGDQIKVLVTLLDDVEAIKAQASREADSFNGYRSLEEELEREQRRHCGAPVYARKTSGSISDRVTEAHFTTAGKTANRTRSLSSARHSISH
jgi:hypothetical protein